MAKPQFFPGSGASAIAQSSAGGFGGFGGSHASAAANAGSLWG